MSLAILFHFLCVQHLSDINISIVRSLRLFCWITTLVVLFLVRCVLEFRCGWVGVVSVLQAEAWTNTADRPRLLTLISSWRRFKHYWIVRLTYRDTNRREIVLKLSGTFLISRSRSRLQPKHDFNIPRSFVKEWTRLKRNFKSWECQGSHEYINKCPNFAAIL